MDDFIKNNYNIIETYEKNEYQEIEMGTKINDSESIIVVNTIKKLDSYTNNLKSVLENSLHNLLYINETDENIILATNYHDGVTLNDYLKSSNSNDKIKFNLAEEYLGAISKYKNLTNNFKKILVDRKQICIKSNNTLFLNELLLISNDEKLDFNEITLAIGEVLDMLLPRDEFIDSLLNGSSVYTSIEDIKNAFNSKYEEPIEENVDNIIPLIKSDDSEENLNDIKKDKVIDESKKDIDESYYSNKEEEIELTSLKFIDEEPTEKKIKSHNKNDKKMILSSLLILGILLIGFLLTRIDYKSFFNTRSAEEIQITFDTERNNSDFKFTAIVDEDANYTYEWKFFSNDEELATFDKKSINIKFKNEGSYTISLRVKDENGTWSKAYSEEIYYTASNMKPLDEKEPADEASSRENLENYTITYETDNIIDDYETKYSGSKSLKFDLNDGKTIGKFKLNDILMKKAVTLSLSVRSDSRNPIKLTFIGSSGNIEKFEKVLNHVPSLENNWEMLSFNINTSNVENLDIIVESEDSTIWIDDIDIKSYK